MWCLMCLSRKRQIRYSRCRGSWKRFVDALINEEKLGPECKPEKKDHNETEGDDDGIPEVPLEHGLSPKDGMNAY